MYLDDDDVSDIQEKLNINKENCGWKKYNWSKDNY